MATARGLIPGRKLKLLFILDAFPDPLAGTEGQFWLLFKGLDRSRFEPAILLLRPSEFLAANVTDAPVKVLGIERLRSPASLWKVLRAALWARRSGYDIAHIFFNDSAIVFPLPLRLAGLRVIVSRRDLGIWYTRGNLHVLRLVRHFVDRAVANCQSVKNAVCRSERFSSQAVSVIYNAWQPRGGPMPARSIARAALGLSSQAQVITIVANLRPLKRVDDAIRAFAIVKQALPAAQLLIVGEDRTAADGSSMQSQLTALSASLGVQADVRFLGKLQDPTEAIAAADVCLLCSETEGLSNSIIEYMSCNRAVVCTDVGGNPELVESGVNGYCVGVGDVAAIAQRIRELLERPDAAAAMGSESARRVAERFSLAANIRSHTALYAELLSNPGMSSQ
jgi:L-malate glycosyltransferase